MQVRPIVVEEADDTDVGMSVVVRLAVQHRLRGHSGSEECHHGDGDDSSNPAHDGLPSVSRRLTVTRAVFHGGGGGKRAPANEDRSARGRRQAVQAYEDTDDAVT